CVLLSLYLSFLSLCLSTYRTTTIELYTLSLHDALPILCAYVSRPAGTSDASTRKRLVGFRLCHPSGAADPHACRRRYPRSGRPQLPRPGITRPFARFHCAL